MFCLLPTASSFEENYWKVTISFLFSCILFLASCYKMKTSLKRWDTLWRIQSSCYLKLFIPYTYYNAHRHFLFCCYTKPLYMTQISTYCIFDKKKCWVVFIFIFLLLLFLGNRKIVVIIVYLFLTGMDDYLCLLVWYYQVWNINNIFWRSVACNMILVFSVTSLWMHPTLTWQQPGVFSDANWWYTEMPYRFFKPIN